MLSKLTFIQAVLLHAPVTIPNAAFFFDRGRGFRFYNEVSPSGSKLVEIIDGERIKVAKALDCEVVCEEDVIQGFISLK